MLCNLLGKTEGIMGVKVGGVITIELFGALHSIPPCAEIPLNRQSTTTARENPEKPFGVLLRCVLILIPIYIPPPNRVGRRGPTAEKVLGGGGDWVHR